MMDTKLKKSISFHPQIHGQTMKKSIVHLLRGYCSKHTKLWDEHLHYIQHAYNHAKQSSTNTSPFEACFGYLPKSPLDFILEKDVAIEGHSDIDKAHLFIEIIQLIHQQIQEQLENGQGKDKERHDKHRVDHKFQEGHELPSIDDFLPEFLDELKEDAILDRRTHTSRRGNVDYVWVGIQSSKPDKAKWMEVDRVRELYPRLFNR
eukprot:PITA_35170